MKKVLIVTLCGNTNYGNKLQLYALQKKISEFGCNVNNAWYDYKPDNAFVLRIIKSVVKTILRFFGVKKYPKENISKLIAEYYKSRRIRKFHKCRIKQSIKVDLNDINPKLSDEYSLIITGSDQVWHKWYTDWEDELKYFYLMFAPKEKRCSYAASFGFDKFDEKYKSIHMDGLHQMKYLSCREYAMKDMIKTISGREAELVCDPTMLLTANEWEDFSRKPSFELPEKYCVVAFLGEVTNEVEVYINRIARIRNYSIIDFSDYKSRYFDSTPDEFVYIIKNADFVLSDSFHATLFSILFHKNFMCFKRVQNGKLSNMFARIKGLMELLCIDGHIYDEVKLNSAFPEKIDFGVVEKRIEMIKTKSCRWLKGVLTDTECLS